MRFGGLPATPMSLWPPGVSRSFKPFDLDASNTRDRLIRFETEIYCPPRLVIASRCQS